MDQVRRGNGYDGGAKADGTDITDGDGDEHGWEFYGERGLGDNDYRGVL